MCNIYRIIPRSLRRRGRLAIATLFVRAALNFAGLAALLPLLVLALDPASMAPEGRLHELYNTLGFASPRLFAYALCGAAVALVVVKSLANMALARVERNFTDQTYRTLSRRLYLSYHDRGLRFIQGSNSSQLARDVNVACLAFAAGVLRPAGVIAAEGALVVLLLGALAIYSPMATLLSLALLVPAGWGYFVLVRRRLDRYGAAENRAQREKSRLVAESLRGYADIEVNDAFPEMLASFDRSMEAILAARKQEFSYTLLPQALTEIALAAAIALLAALGIAGTGGVTPLLFGAFAVAALRLVPSLRNILAAWGTIRYNRYSVDVLRNALAGAKAAPAGGPTTAEDDLPGRLPFEREIAVRELRFGFGGRELFGGLSLTIHKGERIGIRGASGAGKTTLLNLLLGLYQPDGGRIEIDGVPLTPANRRAWQNRIGYVSQHLFLTDGTLAENIALGVPAGQIDPERIAEVLRKACLGEYAHQTDLRTGEFGSRLSGGQRQRIGIARALYRRADVLMFDEATSALDHQTEDELNRSLAALAARHPGMTLIVVAHRESTLAHCTRIITIGE